jgi:hypothetical protein
MPLDYQHLREERAAGEVVNAVLSVLQVVELCGAEDDAPLRASRKI